MSMLNMLNEISASVGTKQVKVAVGKLAINFASLKNW